MAGRDNFELANGRARELQKAFPRAVSAHYDRASGRVVVELSSKIAVSFRAEDAQGLEHANAADFYVPALLEGFLGSRKWMAARMGEVGGKSRSKAKTAAARANGLKGGRPRRKEVAAGD